MTKLKMLPKGIGGAKFDLTKTFSNQLFSHVRLSDLLKYFEVQL